MQEKICLIIPCYQEANRLIGASLPTQTDVVFVLVDDGSKDGTHAAMERLARPSDLLLRLPQNKGKAEAVRQGVQFALSQQSVRDCKWIGFWDADFATPIDELKHFLSYAQSYGTPDAIWGSRIYRAGAHIERRLSRHLLGRLFATVAKWSLNLETYDSQCGAKIFRYELATEIFSTPFLSRWLFDIELYLRLKRNGARLVEYPVREWRDVANGQLRVGKLLLRTIIDIYRIRRAYRR